MSFCAWCVSACVRPAVRNTTEVSAEIDPAKPSTSPASSATSPAAPSPTPPQPPAPTGAPRRVTDVSLTAGCSSSRPASAAEAPSKRDPSSTRIFVANDEPPPPPPPCSSRPPLPALALVAPLVVVVVVWATRSAASCATTVPRRGSSSSAQSTMYATPTTATGSPTCPTSRNAKVSPPCPSEAALTMRLTEVPICVHMPPRMVAKESGMSSCAACSRQSRAQCSTTGMSMATTGVLFMNADTHTTAGSRRARAPRVVRGRPRHMTT